MYKQVKFLNAYDDRILCGIGIFEDNKLIGVICDECGCGGFFGADDVLWYEVMEWIDILTPQEWDWKETVSES